MGTIIITSKPASFLGQKVRLVSFEEKDHAYQKRIECYWLRSGEAILRVMIGKHVKEEIKLTEPETESIADVIHVLYKKYHFITK